MHYTHRSASNPNLGEAPSLTAIRNMFLESIPDPKSLPLDSLRLTALSRPGRFAWL